VSQHNQTNEATCSQSIGGPIRLGFITVAELHKMLGDMIERGHGHLPVVASDQRAYYPLQLHVPYNSTGYAIALSIQPRADARFVEDGDRPREWNREADEIEARCGAFA
jgi:hypothetical protein